MWQPSSCTWVLIDFGLLAKVGEDAVVGFTPTYAAPEMIQAQQAGKRAITADTAVDAWALGVIAFELFLGQSPFGWGVPAEEVRLLHAVCCVGVLCAV